MTTHIFHHLRETALSDLSRIFHPEWGLRASGSGRFTAFFVRDAATSTILSLSQPENAHVPELITAAIAAQVTAARLQGKKENPATEEAPGKMPHEYHDASCPQERLAALLDAGWPVFRHEDQSLGMVYYGAGDATALFTISVAVVARALKQSSPERAAEYIRQFWPHVAAGIGHDFTHGDVDDDGLIESLPRNPRALLNHTWKDSRTAYIDEEGRLPAAPYKYLTNNCYFLWSLREGAWLAREVGDTSKAEEWQWRYAQGVEALHQRFWMPEEQYFAPLIDGEGRQVRFISDDVLEGLWGRIFRPEYAQAVIERLKQPDMNSAVGLRTRSALSRQFKVNGGFAYHNGVVWLHRNRIAAEGLEHYGAHAFAIDLDMKMARVEEKYGRVECLAVQRNGRIMPYLENRARVACEPQAWAVHGSLARTAKVAVPPVMRHIGSDGEQNEQ